MDVRTEPTTIYGTEFVSLDVETALGPPSRCPSCHAGGLVATFHGASVCFRCPRCQGMWRFEMDTLVAVTATSQPHVPPPGPDPS